MAQNYRQPGHQIDFTLAGTVTSGSVVLIGSRVGIALRSGVSGDVIALGVEGVYRVTKATGTAWTVGAPIYWDATASKFTTVSTSNTLAGWAVTPQVSGDVVGDVKLLG